MIQEVMDLSRNVAVVTRYSQAHLVRPESVLEHTGFVCVVAMMIGLEHGNVDMGSLMMKAASHDLEESRIGDIANPVKYANESILKEVTKIGEWAMVDITNELKLPELYAIWNNSKDSTLEGRIVKLADVLSVLMKLQEEVVMYSNVSIKSYAKNTLNFFKDQLMIERDSVLIDILEEAIHINKEILT